MKTASHGFTRRGARLHLALPDKQDGRGRGLWDNAGSRASPARA